MLQFRDPGDKIRKGCLRTDGADPPSLMVHYDQRKKPNKTYAGGLSGLG
jgi:hypothetical protein